MIDGGKNKDIEFKYSGRYCISGGGSFENVTFKNLKFTNSKDAFYFIQSRGRNLKIENNTGCIPV